ncbi:SulP family inorganic anion transporter [bacterium endosymbiont of Bathymodiolus sp. 5 South]|jgi:SulP family sulfate permease|uniref:SulP family inorganic anion transporter n=1 Tax=bacterium endosymbiont of Bathymodiolus sp. 5 South TaxID=1181670 RepID=UPI0010AFD44F|nr:SulP family inorganic anion transporter [bacterium endosymbiont of Bathymodiolus sp. 5 South]CAC9456120.1 Sulfate permease [uncultured Gammaproteobacteria bacterium]CAC9641282.1 Sulfate permease [uncultured Gammaproteobacteria bacterium]CAC9644575.1 Sulfate permease [uncultured Gammaproteobacteria bacterium]CAC9658214.1 Sulfate permease [uncultured Gammaproteobacteria bacterium]SHN93065.1 Sulfate permease [bacterium endosymbiont of Bathymodiolus sp. 5 South]
MLFSLINKYISINPKNDILSGLTVALALVPEAVAFALLAGVDPLVGLYAAFTIGLVTSIIGGRPGMISGATGAIAVVIGTLVAVHGEQYLFAAVVLTGLIQIAFGLLKLGKFIRLVPHPVFLGFVNGIAMVIFIGQIKQFKIGDAWITGEPLMIMLAIIAATMAIIYFLPKFSKVVPEILVAVIVGSLAVIWLGLDTRTVGDIASIKGGIPAFHIPDVAFNFATLTIIFPYALTMALVGLIESLLTLNLVDDLTETTGQPNRESVGQGVANTLTGLFGGMGGCAMVGQSIINIKSGGRGRLSGIVAAVALLLFILYLSEYIEMIPIAVLIGVMFMVVIGTFEWCTLSLFGKIPVLDIVTGISVAVITVLTDNLALAVIVGVILSALSFAWESASKIFVKQHQNDKGNNVYEVHGTLFFASKEHFQELFDPKADTNDVYIDFGNARVLDHSAIQAIDKLAIRYKRIGKTLHLQHLSAECRLLLKTAKNLVEVNVLEDPTYHVADDKLA